MSGIAQKNWPSGPSGTEVWPSRTPAYLNRSFRSAPCLSGAPVLLQPHSDRHPSVDCPLSTPAITQSPFIADRLSPSQVSRASATAIRISLARGATWDAFHLWHSLRWSAHHYFKPVSSTVSRPKFCNPITAFVPIDFGQSVPTRFAGHCLLHGLLRAGETKTAALLAEQMMANGEELRPLSFNILLRLLHPLAGPNRPRTIYDRFRNDTPRELPFGPRVLILRRVMPRDPFTRLAVRLLSNAREHRWQRTTGMYECVLRACLLQGEILVASLLLALLLKDYQLKQACSRVAAEAENVGAPDTMAYIESKLPDIPSRGFKALPDRSSRFLFQSVTDFLAIHCANVDDPLFPEASQALVTLASALDARTIPYPNLSKLIAILYSYPQCKHKVWVSVPSGALQHLNAYYYFHRVLFDLLYSLPDRRSHDVHTPALNLRSYNALLKYAMGFRHSLSLADRVLRHMTELRKPPLAPDMATYNTLLRGCTLLRRNELAESILRMMRRRMSGSQVEMFIPHFPPTTKETNQQTGPSRNDQTLQPLPHHRRFDGLLKEIREYELVIPKPKGFLEPDNILLTTYKAHLIATGRPDAAVTLILRVIPELESFQMRLPSQRLSAKWSACVANGVTLGPYFFAVALNALRKARRKRFAECVWALARDAEAKSLEPGSVTPWCLSTHAYTTMLQLYADDMKGWHAPRQPRGSSRGITRAKLSGRLSRSKNPLGAKLALRKGMQIYREMRRAAERVRTTGVRGRNQDLELPTADARFYNAALGLVSRRPGMSPRSFRPRSPSWWNCRLGAAHEQLLLKGVKPHGWTPELEEILQGVKSSGYAIPLGFRLKLVGRDPDAEVTWRGKVDIGPRPLSFGKRARSRFSPYRIPTVKTRGLPVRGRWRCQRWAEMNAPGMNAPEMNAHEQILV